MQNIELTSVLQDFENDENWGQTIGILKLISQGEEDIRIGDISTQDKVFSELEKLLN